MSARAPGGRTAADCMTRDPLTLRPDMDVLEAIAVLIRHEIAGAPVVDETGMLVGMLTERDCMQAVLQASYHGEPGGRVGDLMTRTPRTVDGSTSLLDLARLFAETPYRAFPVLDGGRLAGIVARRDVLRAVQEIAAAGG
jgi:CBS domain-containing protein